jgi:hypothetical protein
MDACLHESMAHWRAASEAARVHSLEVPYCSRATTHNVAASSLRRPAPSPAQFHEIDLGWSQEGICSEIAGVELSLRQRTREKEIQINTPVMKNTCVKLSNTERHTN